jgi:hypothetical protein
MGITPWEEDGLIYGRTARLEAGASLIQDGFAMMNEHITTEHDMIRWASLEKDGSVILHHGPIPKQEQTPDPKK